MSGGAGAQVSDAGIVGEFPPAGEGLPLYRPAGSVAALAVATEGWLPVPTHQRQLLGNYQFIPDVVAGAARGQRFRLLEAEGGWDVTRGEGVFVASPWTLGCGCAEVGWQEPTWVPPGDTVAFLLTPTRSKASNGGAPAGGVSPPRHSGPAPPEADWLMKLMAL